MAIKSFTCVIVARIASSNVLLSSAIMQDLGLLCYRREMSLKEGAQSMLEMIVRMAPRIETKCSNPSSGMELLGTQTTCMAVKLQVDQVSIN